ncbi:hypothetical protein [Sporosarcina sp. NPDC096371]|uniref:hypothetical protein n=1 Tax=Sporosarcina sp. NPDC096371 TaxID=3364530 RepID=UPI0037FE4C74
MALVFLFIVQIIGFYFLVLLYTKVSKFDDLEKKQRKLMTEMDDSIGAYLSELKDENERLIERLAARDRVVIAPKVDSQKNSKEVAVALEQPKPVIRAKKPVIPVNLALKSYNSISTAQEPSVEADDARTQAFKLHDAGQSIEQIAKVLGKGRTEVELILKFR